MTTKLKGMTPLLQVFDMPTSIRFHRDVMGFDIVEHSPPRVSDDFDWCLIRRDGIQLMLNTAYEFESRPTSPDITRRAGHVDVTLFIGCPDVDGAYAELRDKGLAMDEPRTAPYGMKQLFLKDPDGYGLCLQWGDDVGTIEWEREQGHVRRDDG